MALEPRRITPEIYQGGWIRPPHIPELLQIGITHILNLDSPYEDEGPFREAGFNLLNLYIRDASLMTPQLVRDALSLIEQSLAAPGKKIYIHCNEGVSRSPTITWLYLIHKGLAPEEALLKVRPNKLLYDEGIVRQLIADRS